MTSFTPVSSHQISAQDPQTAAQPTAPEQASPQRELIRRATAAMRAAREKQSVAQAFMNSDPNDFPPPADPK